MSEFEQRIILEAREAGIPEEEIQKWLEEM